MAQKPREYLTLPVGRFISGDLIQKNTTDHQNNPLPENKHNWWFAVAVEKANPAVGPILGAIQQKAVEWHQNLPHVVQRVQQGIMPGGFKFKIDDGDDPNQWKGDHGKGCWIFKFSTTQPFKGANNQNQEIPLDHIKRGYFVDVAFSISPNGNQDHTAGLYMNPHTVRLIGYGDEIVSGPSIEQQFSQAQTGYVPAGMSQTPVAGAMGGAMHGQDPNAGGMGDQMGGNPMQGGQMQHNPMQGDQMGGNPMQGGQMQHNPNAGAMGGQMGGNPNAGAMGGQMGGNPMQGGQMGGNPMQGGQMGGNPNAGAMGGQMGGQMGGGMPGVDPNAGGQMGGMGGQMGGNPGGMPGVDPNAQNGFGAPMQNGTGGDGATSSHTNGQQGYNGYMNG